jgi:transposase
MRPKGTSAELEQRRRHAVAMLRRGVKPATVAKALRVSLVSVGRWRKAAAGGPMALAAGPHPRRPLRLSLFRRRQLLGLLARGPTHHGFGTELWTLARVARVIWRRWSVSYHPSQVWRILSASGWSCQKPESRARERDERAVARWRRYDWPRIKKSCEIRLERAVPGRDGPDAPAAGAAHLGTQR